MNNGEYSECPVAIKRLKMTEEDSDGTFKVPPLDSTHPLLSLSFYPGIMPRDNQLETSVSSEHLTFVGGFYVSRPALFAHSHRVDVQWECDAVLGIQPKGEPFATGGLACCMSRVPSCSSTVLSSLRLCLVPHTFMTSGSFMGISKACV